MTKPPTLCHRCGSPTSRRGVKTCLECHRGVRADGSVLCRLCDTWMDASRFSPITRPHLQPNRPYRSWCKRCESRQNSIRQAANKERKRAHMAVYWDCRLGKVQRPDRCSECGRACKPHAHHADYSKPREYVWLCSTCHRAKHGAQGGRKGKLRAAQEPSRH